MLQQLMEQFIIEQAHEMEHLEALWGRLDMAIERRREESVERDDMPLGWLT